MHNFFKKIKIKIKKKKKKKMEKNLGEELMFDELIVQ